MIVWYGLSNPEESLATYGMIWGSEAYDYVWNIKGETRRYRAKQCNGKSSRMLWQESLGKDDLLQPALRGTKLLWMQPKVHTHTQKAEAVRSV